MYFGDYFDFCIKNLQNYIYYILVVTNTNCVRRLGKMRLSKMSTLAHYSPTAGPNH